jgi:hypothetical protein
MQTNGIGPLVRQFVHERNATRAAARRAEAGGTPAAPAAPEVKWETDTASVSAAALARFAAWQARHAPAAAPQAPAAGGGEAPGSTGSQPTDVPQATLLPE